MSSLSSSSSRGPRGRGNFDSRSAEEIEFDLPEIKPNYSIENIVILDNLPQIPVSKRAKLLKVLLGEIKKVDVKPMAISEFVASALPDDLAMCESQPDGTCPAFVPGESKGTVKPCGEPSQFGRYCATHKTNLVISMPITEQAKTKGYAFMELSSPAAAKKVIKQLNGMPLDKKHKIKATLATYVEEALAADDDFDEPEIQEYEDMGDLLYYLKDLSGRDQYAIRYGDDTEVFWNNPFDEIHDLVRSRQFWTDAFIEWSPLGTYLATVHEKGVALWGGEEWSKKRFAHDYVQVLGFSPKEKYLVTFNNQENDDPKDPNAIVIWDIVSGQRKAAFTMDKFHIVNSTPWPFFKWSFDDKFFARIGENTLSVYETPSMKLLNHKAIHIEAVRDFDWSPSDDILAFWVPENGEKPANVTLMSFPEMEIVGQKNLFNVNDVKIHWHPTGDFLCVNVQRVSKTGNTFYTNFEFFRMREKNIPVEAMEIKDEVQAFAWEPQNDRFALIKGASKTNPQISVYGMNVDDGVNTGLGLVHDFGNLPANTLFWSPQGRYIVLAGLGNNSGVLQFWDVERKCMMGEAEHFMCTDVSWDPTGRFVCSFVTNWRHSMENGFNIWDFQGRLMHRSAKDKFYQMLWRPRPPSLLDAKEKKKVKKLLKKKFTAQFEKEDTIREESLSGSLTAERKELRDEMDSYMAEKREEYRAMHDARVKLTGYDSENDEDMEYTEETIEIVVEVSEEPVSL